MTQTNQTLHNRTVYVHIGMHKTGSSSIQKTLHNSLEDPNYVYVDLGGENHSGKIQSLFSTDPFTNHNHRKCGWDLSKINKFNKDTRSNLIKQLSNSTSNMIISGEGITAIDKPGLLSFKYFLRNYFRNIVIVAYIRPPISYMESAFQEKIKGSLKKLDLEKIYPNYRKRFEIGRAHV